MNPEQKVDQELGGHQFGGHQFGGHQFGGWLGDLPDRRDQPLYEPLVAPTATQRVQAQAELPVSHEIPWHMPVLQQRPLQSCVSCAVATVVRHLDAAGREVIDPGPSSLFLYYNTRLLEHRERCDTGSGIRSALKALNRYGICTEAVWGPDRQVVERPGPEAYEDVFYAGTVTYKHVYRLGEEPGGLDLTPVRRALSQGLPVIFGFSVYESFRAAGAGEPVALPGDDERLLFGHASVLIGYDEEGFTAVNSWGDDWGNRGRFTLPKAYLSDRRLAKDFWVITSLDGGGAQEAGAGERPGVAASA